MTGVPRIFLMSLCLLLIPAALMAQAKKDKPEAPKTKSSDKPVGNSDSEFLNKEGNFSQENLPRNNQRPDMGMQELNTATHKDELERPLQAYLKAFTGTWSGKLNVSSLRGKTLNTFEVQQEYWWVEDKKQLKGLAVFDDAGVLRHSESINYIDDGVIYSEVTENDKTQTYQALIEDKNKKTDSFTITWLPVEQSRALDHQLKQKLVKKDGENYIVNKGYERFKRGSIDTVILLDGKLKELSAE